jgi:hypothetical protein
MRAIEWRGLVAVARRLLRDAGVTIAALRAGAIAARHHRPAAPELKRPLKTAGIAITLRMLPTWPILFSMTPSGLGSTLN